LYAKSIDDFINTFESLAKTFKQWKEWGIELCDVGGVGDDYATFITDNIDIAIKADFAFKRGKYYYLETLSDEDIKVPKEKIDKK
jgi:hypothetical protein